MIRVQRLAGAALAAAALIAAGGTAAMAAELPASPCFNPQTINLRTGQVVWSSWYGNQTNHVQTPVPDPAWVPNTTAKWINDGRSSGTGLGTGGELENTKLTVGAAAPAALAEPIETAPSGSTNATGVYRYSTSFWAEGSGTVNFAFAGDNAVEFYLNNVFVGGFTPLGGQNGTNAAMQQAFSRWHNLSASGVRYGWNTLEARVTNYHGVTGVIVDGTATVCAPPDVEIGPTRVEACVEEAVCTRLAPLDG